MRIIFTLIIGFSLLAAGCASQGHSKKTKISQKYHKKEYPRDQANINSLHYSNVYKKKSNKPGFFKRLFPKKKSYYAGQ